MCSFASNPCTPHERERHVASLGWHASLVSLVSPMSLTRETAPARCLHLSTPSRSCLLCTSLPFLLLLPAFPCAHQSSVGNVSTKTSSAILERSGRQIPGARTCAVRDRPAPTPFLHRGPRKAGIPPASARGVSRGPDILTKSCSQQGRPQHSALAATLQQDFQPTTHRYNGLLNLHI